MRAADGMSDAPSHIGDLQAANMNNTEQRKVADAVAGAAH